MNRRGCSRLERQERMRGTHAPLNQPEAGRIYAFLLDVGGAETAVMDEMSAPNLAGNARDHDSTALTVVEVDLTTVQVDTQKAPTYLVRARVAWSGVDQPTLYLLLKQWADRWKPRKIVVDATGLGAGLSAYLQKAYSSRVRPFVFSAVSKSNLGWDFLSVCDTGRFKDYRPVEGDSLAAALLAPGDCLPDGIAGRGRLPHPLGCSGWDT